MVDNRVLALNEINTERNNQEAKWGEQHHEEVTWYVILGEEFGEIGKAINEKRLEKGTAKEIKKEIIQTAAVCVAWLENIIEREGI